MNVDIKIVETKEELEEFMELYLEIFPGLNMNLSGEDIIFLSYVDGEAVGFVHFIEKGEFYGIKGFGVLEEFRRYGVGQLLLNECTNRLNLKPIYLKIGSLHPSIELYTSCGFFMEEFGGEHLLVKRAFN